MGYSCACVHVCRYRHVHLCKYIRRCHVNIHILFIHHHGRARSGTTLYRGTRTFHPGITAESGEERTPLVPPPSVSLVPSRLPGNDSWRRPSPLCTVHSALCNIDATPWHCCPRLVRLRSRLRGCTGMHIARWLRVLQSRLCVCPLRGASGRCLGALSRGVVSLALLSLALLSLLSLSCPLRCGVRVVCLAAVMPSAVCVCIYTQVRFTPGHISKGN